MPMSTLSVDTLPPASMEPVVQSEAVAVDVPAENTVKSAPPYERSMIAQWLREAKVPTWLRTSWDRWKKDRDYINEELFADDNPNQLSVNLTARAVQQKVSTILPFDADCSVRFERGVGSVAIVRRDAIRKAKAMLEQAGLPLMAPMLMMAADQAEQEYRDTLEARMRLAQTSEAVIKKLWDEGSGTQAARDLAQSAMTVGMSWFKVGWHRDYGRDSLGRFRYDDSQDQMAHLALRAAEFAHGVFGENDSRYGELIKLSDYARIVAKAVMEGAAEPGSVPFAGWKDIAQSREKEPLGMRWMPEVEVWQGPVIDQVQPECMRWDWRIPVSRWHESPYLMEQVPMDVDECAAIYKLTPAERDRLAGRNEAASTADNAKQLGDQKGENGNPDNVDYEAQVQRGKVIVWERWDRKLHRRTVFVEGLDRFLFDEVVKDAPPGFYRYVCVSFNDSDGAKVPPSDVRYMRKIQDAINQRCTDGQESLWASMKRYIVKKGAFRDGELDKLRGARPHDVVEMDDPGEIKASWTEISSDDWNPAKYDLGQLFRLWELVSGMSISQLGVTGQANFAAEANIANQSSQQTAGRHGLAMAEALTRAMTIVHFDAFNNLSERTVQWLVGGAGYWPEPPSRMDLFRALRVKVEAAGSRQTAKAAAAQEAREAMTALGQAIDLRARGQAAGVKVELAPLVAAISKAIDVEAPAREIVQVDATTDMPPVQLPPNLIAQGIAPPQQPNPDSGDTPSPEKPKPSTMP